MKQPNLSICRRWIDIGLYAVLGCFVGKAIPPLVSGAVREAFARTTNYWIWIGPTVGPILIATIALVWLHWVAGFRFQHLLRTHRYPSFVFGIVGALALDGGLDLGGMSPKWFGWPGQIWALITYAAILAMAGMLRLFRNEGRVSNRSKSASLPQDRTLETIPIEQILNWAEDERPIAESSNDLFDLGVRARRVLRYLTGERRKAVAIVGPFGSGKTSVVNLMLEEAKKIERPGLWFVSVSCWGFDSAPAAQEAVLKKIVADLARRVDCFAIQGMPAKYIDALSKTSTHVDLIFRFLSSGDPDAQLRRISPILKAINERVVVVIEDTDRHSVAFDTTSIEGLLHRFREVEGLRFVVTAGPDSKVDFLRLCEHTEALPDLDPAVALRVLDRVRSYSREKHAGDIDPARRKNLMEGMYRMSGVTLGFLGRVAWEWQMARFVATPRRLKAVVRRFYDAWERLHGEVDIDELLVATCLRVCSPPVFSFLIRRHGALERVRTEPNSPPDPVLATLREEWQSLTSNGSDLQIAGRLLQVLFPPSHVIFSETVYQHIDSIQQFRSEMRDVYRDRIFNEEPSFGIPSDQSVLQSIARGRRDKAAWKGLAKLLEESDDALEIVSFFRRFLDRDIWEVSVELFALLREKYGSSAGQQSPAFRQLCIWSRNDLYQTPGYSDMVFGQIELCIPKFLQLATALFSFLFSDMPDSAYVPMSDRVMNQLRRFLGSDGPVVLAEGLDELCPLTLKYLLTMDVRGDSSQEGARRAPNWKKWSWIGQILLESVRKFPQKMVPQVAHVLGLSHSHESLPSDFIVNEQPLSDVFGEHAKDLMLELSRPFPINSELQQGYHQVDLALVNPRAQRWLANHS